MPSLEELLGGLILDKLEERNISENTIVILFSDTPPSFKNN